MCICRIKTPVYPLMETTAAAAWSWLTLSARRPSSSTETKLLPSRDRKEKRDTLLFYSPCCLFYKCGKYSETLYTVYDKHKPERGVILNRHYLLWGCTCIFFWCTFSTKGLIVIKGFYCLYKITEYMWFCFITVAWWWVHCGCRHMKSALERRAMETLKLLSFYFFL